MGKKATVLAVKVTDLEGLTGTIPIPEGFNPPIWAGPRPALENDLTFRHPIPYILVKTREGYLTYMRGDSGGENRLHGQVSIGFGGHMDCADAVYHDEELTINFWATLFITAIKEMHEELGITVSVEQLHPLGLILSDDPEVDRVHLAVVLILDLTDYEGEYVAEDCIKNVQSLTKEQLLDTTSEFALESWSQKALTLV